MEIEMILHSTTHRRTAGFTLVETMIVVVILAIIAAVGYPTYIEYVVRSHRQAARAALYQVADRQEQFFLDNKRYAATLDELNYADEVIGLDQDGQFTAADDAGRTYRVTLDGDEASDTTYTVQAIPDLVQAERDTDCGTLSLTHTGERDQTGDGANCW
jgi:type IV pilus assembly protein PilE